MANPGSKQAIWEQRLQEWKKSELSEIKWCKNQNISKSTFRYWKSKLQPSIQKQVLFEELKEASPSAIELRWGEARLYLDKDFDIATLEKCLIALRRAQC